MKTSEKGQGAIEYLLMLAAVLIIVAIAVYYIMTVGPAAVITGSAELKSGDPTAVIFTPATTMAPAKIKAADWEWAIYRDATLLGSGPGVADLERGKPVELDIVPSAASGDKVKIKYKETWYDAATVA